DYAFALCPDPLGAMMCFYAEGGSVDCLDLSIDNEFAGTPSTFTVTGGTPNAQVALYYTLIDPGDVLDCLAEEYRRCRDGGGSWLKCIGVAIANCTKRAVQYARGTFDSTGTFQDTLAVPCAAGDKTVWFFGVSQGPDGEVDCYSDALEVTFAPC
ncbi:MAG: hypothetical protein D8M59_16145, partial [Planctomycetes bacterium]|nr:hypothetical protein [Planctomycetota bacterium]